jgi:hypothetical protein
MNGYIKTTGIIAGFILAIMVMPPVYALEGSMGPPRMTLRTEVPFMSQGVIEEVPIRVANTANELERVMFFTTDDLNNSDIMEVEFTENQLMLKPNEQKVINVTFKVKKPGTFSGNIVTMFKSSSEQSDSAIGSTVGFRLNSKVTILAESKGPSIKMPSIGVIGIVAISLALGIFLYKKFWR